MESLTIPSHSPLHVAINTFWDGSICDDHVLHSQVEIRQSSSGIKLTARGNILKNPRIPDALKKTRVDGLWEYDVVEVFFAGKNGYLEIELGAGGHWLVLGFSGVRAQSKAYMDFDPPFSYALLQNSMWESSITIPWHMIPQPLTRMNAFAILDGNFLARSPLPGDTPDFHQPSRYPLVTLEKRDERI